MHKEHMHFNALWERGNIERNKIIKNQPYRSSRIYLILGP